MQMIHKRKYLKDVIIVTLLLCNFLLITIASSEVAPIISAISMEFTSTDGSNSENTVETSTDNHDSLTTNIPIATTVSPTITPTSTPLPIVTNDGVPSSELTALTNDTNEVPNLESEIIGELDGSHCGDGSNSNIDDECILRMDQGQQKQQDTIAPLIQFDKESTTKKPQSTKSVNLYKSTFCRCRQSECQNDFPGDSELPMCKTVDMDEKCPTGYTRCISTSSYKLQVEPSTPNSVADLKFSLLASDIVGAFCNAGEEPALQSQDTKTRLDWYVAISLPKGMRFVESVQPTVEVTFSGDIVESRVYELLSCKNITESTCHSSESNQFGFVNIKDMVQGRIDALKASSTKSPLAFVMKKSVVSCPPSGCQNGKGVNLYLVYKSKKAISRRRLLTPMHMRELQISASEEHFKNDERYMSIMLDGTLKVIPLATMDVPDINEEDSLYGSLVWVEEQKASITLSFSTSSIIGLNAVNPKICVNLRSDRCAKISRTPKQSFLWADDSKLEAEYALGGNPFVALYREPDTSRPIVKAINESYLCVTELRPSGVEVNKSWEAQPEFSFLMQLSNIRLGTKDMRENSEETKSSQNRTFSPLLVEVMLIDDDGLQGYDCAQLLIQAPAEMSYALSVYSVMSLILYAIGLVGAILVTRMNGVKFSPGTFYDDMTSVCIVLVLFFSIFANAVWIQVASNGQSTDQSFIYYMLELVVACCIWTMMTSAIFHWTIVLSKKVRKSSQAAIGFAFFIINAAFYTTILVTLLTMTKYYKCVYDDYLKNPLYKLRYCDTDYCPNLQPSQWKHASTVVCRDTYGKGWDIMSLFGFDFLHFSETVVLVGIATALLTRGKRSLDQSNAPHLANHCNEANLAKAMRKSLIMFLVLTVSMMIILGVSLVLNIILYLNNWRLYSVLWYSISVWLPRLIPPCAFLLLQWNPHFSGVQKYPGNGQQGTNGRLRRSTIHSVPTKVKNSTVDITKAPMFSSITPQNFMRESQVSYEQLSDINYPETSQHAADAEVNITPNDQSGFILSLQLEVPNALSAACYVDVYLSKSADDSNEGDCENDVAGEGRDTHQDVSDGTRVSISSLIRMSVVPPPQNDSFLLGSIIENERKSFNEGLQHHNQFGVLNSQDWQKIGSTEAVLPLLTESSNTFIASFATIIQIPETHTSQYDFSSTKFLRFIVYEIPDVLDSEFGGIEGSTNDRLSWRNSRVSGLAIATRRRRIALCEFTSSCGELRDGGEYHVIARNGSHRILDSSLSSPLNENEKVRSNNEDVAPVLRITSMPGTIGPHSEKGDANNLDIVKCFQFDREHEIGVIEQACVSHFANSITYQFLDSLLRERSEYDLTAAVQDLQLFDQARASALASSYTTRSKQLQKESEDTIVRTWLEDRVEQRRLYIDDIKNCQEHYHQRINVDNLKIKFSSEKKSILLRFLPVNLHIQRLWTGPITQLQKAELLLTSPSIHKYTTVTVGAFAAHCYKFQGGEGILSIQRQISALRPRLNRHVNEMRWRDAALRTQDELEWHAKTRLDTCLAQAIATLTTSFVETLEDALRRPNPEQPNLGGCVNGGTFLRVLESQGFLFHVESLLAPQGKEGGMLEDFAAAIEKLQDVGFVLNVRQSVKETYLSSVVSVSLVNEDEEHGSSDPKQKRAYTVVVNASMPSNVIARLPSGLRSGRKIPVTPILFAQCIEELQITKRLSKSGSTSSIPLYHRINQENLKRLSTYFERFQTLAGSNQSIMSTCDVVSERFKLLAGYILGSPKQATTLNPAFVLHESAFITRCLGAGRVTACKSGKDKTDMAVTLEQGSILTTFHGLKVSEKERIVSSMRSNGVRLELASQNSGKKQYSFSVMQRASMFEEYQCPEGTYER